MNDKPLPQSYSLIKLLSFHWKRLLITLGMVVVFVGIIIKLNELLDYVHISFRFGCWLMRFV
jgi:hypothetical protein